MKWILWSAAALAALLGVVWLAGSLLPVAHTARVSRTVDGPPDRVWSVITGVDAFPEWRPGLDTVELLPARGGRPAWRERGPRGAMTMEVVEWREPERMVTRIADEGLPFGGTWTYELSPTEGGTRVTLTEDGEVYDPFFRFMARFVFGHEGTMRSYLDGLEARMEEGER